MPSILYAKYQPASTSCHNLQQQLPRLGFTDVVVDFLGSLIPGGVFLVGFWIGLVNPTGKALATLFSEDSVSSVDFSEFFLGISELGIGSTTVLIAVGALLSFVVGTVFFRLSPNLVDEKSARRLTDSDLADGMVRAQCVRDAKIEYPYTYLNEYLQQRRLDYIADFIPWTADDLDARTKHFANALKIRIFATAPHLYNVVARNEAHIRLSASLWYVCTALFWSSVFGVVAILMISAAGFISGLATGAVVYIVAPLAILALSHLSTFHIEKSFHYQRVREILHILELASWLRLTGTAPNIFKGLAP